MYSSDDEGLKMTEEHVTEFLHAKHDIYEWKNLHIPRTEQYNWDDMLLDLTELKIFDLWEHDFDIIKNVRLTDHLHFHYVYEGKCQPLLIKFENMAASVIKGRHLKQKLYLEPFAIDQTGCLWRVHSDLICKLNEITEKCVHPLDFGLIHIEATRLPIEKNNIFSTFGNLLRKNKESNLQRKGIILFSRTCYVWTDFTTKSKSVLQF